MSTSIRQQIETLLSALPREQKAELARQLQQEIADTSPAAGPNSAEAAREVAFWNKLADDGILERGPWGSDPTTLVDIQAIPVTGPPLSETIIENRRSWPASNSTAAHWSNATS